MDILTLKQALAEGVLSSLWLVIVASAIAGGLAAFCGAYLKLKAEHLATREDFKPLLEQQEVITRRTKSIEAELQKGIRTYEEQFRVEFDICRQLWRLLTIYKRCSREAIQGAIRQASGVDDLAKRHNQAATELIDCLEMNLPFYADEIYKQVSEFLARLDAVVSTSKDLPPLKEVQFKGQTFVGSTRDRALALVALNQESRLLTDSQITRICETIRGRLKFER